jgi:hypothetical protein
MKVYKKEKVIVERNNIYSYKCDICQKEILSIKNNLPDGWLNFSHSHKDWGNDSIDSIEYFDVCSPECFIKQIRASLKEYECYDGAEVAHMDFPFAVKFIEYLESMSGKEV